MNRVRSWVPWLSVALLVVLAVSSAIAGGVSDHGRTVQTDLGSPFHVPAGRQPTTHLSPSTTLPPEGGYRGIENFCAVPPLTGTIHYDGSSGVLTGSLMVNVAGLPPSDVIFVNWSNDHVRAPVIASFETNSEGSAIQSTVDVGRYGEVRGVEIVVSAASVPNPVFGRLEPC